MNNRKLQRSASEVASFGELREYYDKLIQQMDEIYKESINVDNEAKKAKLRRTT